MLDLLVQSARYAEPALEELDRSLLPGIGSLRSPIKERYRSLWDDGLAGCPELLMAVSQAGLLGDEDPRALFTWLSSAPRRQAIAGELLSEPTRERRAVRRRLAVLGENVPLRRAYRDLLAEVWEVMRPEWVRRGRAVAAKASSGWARRLNGVTAGRELVGLLPPRHPLTRDERMASQVFGRRRRFTIVPIYACMSGGQVADLGDRVHIGVPASALEPVRRTRDATFVADRARILAEPTRVRILIHLMQGPSGVMQMTRALGMTQPTVSEHVRVLAAAGLIRRQRADGGRQSYVASWTRARRVIDDMHGTLARWAGADEGAC